MKALTLTPQTPMNDVDIPGRGRFKWSVAGEDWLQNLRSDRTRRAYGEAWSAFLDFARVAPDQVTQGDVIAYRRHLETTTSPKTLKPYTQETINLRLSALSSFFNFAKDRGLRSDNPVDGVKRKAVTPYGKATWLRPDQNEDRKLVDAIDATSANGQRDRAIMLVFLTMALRVAEVASLKVGSLRRQGQATFVTYTAKRGKTRVKEVPTETAEAIDDYLSARADLTPSSALFVATDRGREAAARLGRSATGGGLTSRAIGYLVKLHANRAFGPGHGIHPHSLRHTAAVTATLEGQSFAEISALLGHESLGVTTIYLHALERDGDKVSRALGRRYGRRPTSEGVAR
jgi:integrase/recombinase XerD